MISPDAVHLTICMATSGARKVNAEYVEIFVHGMPRIGVVTSAAIKAGDEVIVDHGEVHWLTAARLCGKAKHAKALNLEVNRLLDKVQELESDANPLIIQSRCDKEECTMARTMAVEAHD